MRLFIAIRLNDEMIRSVTAVQKAFRSCHVRGNYTPSENMHVTLAFIGEYSDPDAVMAAMETVSFSAFRISMERLGCFGDVWWAGIENSREMGSLAAGLRHSLAEADVPFDRKRFRPHVTFLRKPAFDGGRIPEADVVPATMRVDHFCLMRSDRGKNGMIYTELGRVYAQDV